jgi:phenylacetate-coenzyme A ligase PaaK-like adenylate-forming protein
MPGMDEMRTLESARSSLARAIEAIAGVPAQVTFAEPRSIARQTGGKARRVRDLRGT